jgi:hypothetical protein
MNEAEEHKLLNKFAIAKEVRKRLAEIIKRSVAYQHELETEALAKGEQLPKTYCWEPLNKGELNGNITAVVKSSSVL